MTCIMHFPFAKLGKRSVYSPPPQKKNKQTNKQKTKKTALFNKLGKFMDACCSYLVLKGQIRVRTAPWQLFKVGLMNNLNSLLVSFSYHRQSLVHIKVYRKLSLAHSFGVLYLYFFPRIQR